MMKFVTGNTKKLALCYLFLLLLHIILEIFIMPPLMGFTMVADAWPAKIRPDLVRHHSGRNWAPVTDDSNYHRRQRKQRLSVEQPVQPLPLPPQFFLIIDPNYRELMPAGQDNREEEEQKNISYDQLPIIIKYGPEFFWLASNFSSVAAGDAGWEEEPAVVASSAVTSDDSADPATYYTSGIPLVVDAHGNQDNNNEDNGGGGGQTPYSFSSTAAVLDLWPWQFILIILYTLAALLSLSFNLLTIVVWFCGDRSLSHEIWHLLVNLSVADIGMSIFCIPFTYTNVMLQQWIFPHYLCPVVNFAQLCFVFVSIWTLTIISIDRYLAIVHPLYKFRCRKCTMLAVIWLLGLLFASSQLFVSRATLYLVNPGEFPLYECIEVWPTEIYGQIYTIVVFVVTFAIPVLIITFAYSGIWCHMNRHVIPGNPDTNRDSYLLGVKSKVFKMLATVIGLFVVCWFPIHLFNMLLYFVPSIMIIESPLMLYIYYGSFFASHFLSMVHSLMNPIIYCFMSENFRRNLICLLRRCFNIRYLPRRRRGRHRRSQRQNTASRNYHHRDVSSLPEQPVEMAVHLTYDNETERDKSTIQQEDNIN